MLPVVGGVLTHEREVGVDIQCFRTRAKGGRVAMNVCQGFHQESKSKESRGGFHKESSFPAQTSEERACLTGRQGIMGKQAQQNSNYITKLLSPTSQMEELRHHKENNFPKEI